MLYTLPREDNCTLTLQGLKFVQYFTGINLSPLYFSKFYVTDCEVRLR
jgi:hypothetical protein